MPTMAQHACSSSQHAILQKSHVNIMAEFSMASQNSNMAFQNSNMAFQNFNMAFQNSEHGVSKLRTWRFTRCRARTSNDTVEGKGVGQWLLRLTPVYLRPQKKSPHGLHHLLGYDRLPSPQTSWSYPAWPRTPDSNKARMPCVAACAARRWRATRCDSPAQAARRPSTQATRR
jgi:hypothetical protein